jgi:hypothetical protein
MADFNDLTYFHLQGLFNAITIDSTGNFGDAGPEPDLFNVNMTATISYYLVNMANELIAPPPLLPLPTATPPRTLMIVPMAVEVTSGVLVVPGAIDVQGSAIQGVDMVARSAILGLPEDQKFVAKVVFGAASIGGGLFQFDPIIFEIPAVELEDYTANFVQILTVDPAATGGTWETVYDDTPTTAMAPTVTAATFQGYLNAAIQADLTLPNTTSCVTVAGANGGPFTVTFDTDVIPRPLRLGTLSNLTGAAGTAPQVAVADTYMPTVVDLTTVTQFMPAP